MPRNGGVQGGSSVIFDSVNQVCQALALFELASLLASAQVFVVGLGAHCGWRMEGVDSSDWTPQRQMAARRGGWSGVVRY